MINKTSPTAFKEKQNHKLEFWAFVVKQTNKNLCMADHTYNSCIIDKWWKFVWSRTLRSSPHRDLAASFISTCASVISAGSHQRRIAGGKSNVLGWWSEAIVLTVQNALFSVYCAVKRNALQRTYSLNNAPLSGFGSLQLELVLVSGSLPYPSLITSDNPPHQNWVSLE